MLFVNPDLYFVLRGGVTTVHSYRDKRIFELEPAYLERLVSIAHGTASGNATAIDEDLIAGNLVSRQPYAASVWPFGQDAQIFHLTTKDSNPFVSPEAVESSWSGYLDWCAEVADNIPHFAEPNVQGDWIDLPSSRPDELSESIFKTLVKRRTVREFLPMEVSLGTVSALLYYSFANLPERGRDLEMGAPFPFDIRRSSPSGGGLAATDVYVTLQHVNGLAAGTYFYDPRLHRLGLVTGPVEQTFLGGMLGGHMFAGDVAIGAWLVSRFDKFGTKYPFSRCYRVAMLEAGHLSQTFQLVATALGLGTWLTGAFNDSTVERFLQLDGETAAAALFVAAGHTTGAICDPATLSLLENRTKEQM